MIKCSLLTQFLNFLFKNLQRHVSALRNHLQAEHKTVYIYIYTVLCSYIYTYIYITNLGHCDIYIYITILGHCNIYTHSFMLSLKMVSESRNMSLNVLRKKINKVVLEYNLSPYLIIGLEHNGVALLKNYRSKVP